MKMLLREQKRATQCPWKLKSRSEIREMGYFSLKFSVTKRLSQRIQTDQLY